MGALPMKRYVHKSVFDAALAVGPCEFKLLCNLDVARPNAVQISSLMIWSGMNAEVRPTHRFWNGARHSAYVKFACALVRLKRVLERHGWQLVMSGGTADDWVLLSEQSGSPG